MSLQSTYESVKGLIAENLTSMGVEASSSSGLTTLANQILDIEPSVGGLDLDTSVTLSVSSATVVLGGSITCTATLTAEYDDETLVDVDLHGVLQNATIKLYESSTLKDSATTGSNGVATLTYTPSSTGTKSIKVVFEGTDNFNDCESTSTTITVTEPTVGSIDLVSTKDILSYYDSDTATITATVYDDTASALPMPNKTVTISDGTNTVTRTTDSNGECTYTYTSSGAGDITITANCMSVTETYGIEDCLKVWTDFSTGWSTNGVVKYDTSYTLPDNVQVDFEFNSSNINNVRLGIGDGGGQYCTVYYHNPSTSGGISYYCMYNVSPQTLHTNHVDLTSSSVLSLQLTGSTGKWLHNGTQFDTGSINTSYRKNVRYVDHTSWTPKRIKVKPL